MNVPSKLLLETPSMIVIRKTFAVALLIALLGQAHAAEGQPLPPQDVFRYVIFDAGDAIEIDWAINDGAYMYDSAFAFTAANPAVDLGTPELPEGAIHSDEFLGKQVVHRDNFFVRIPYTINGDRPKSIVLTIESRGCLDSGYCYMPQTWIETVALTQAIRSSDKLTLQGLTGSSADDPLPPNEVFIADAFAVDGNTIEFGIRILPGYYLYKSKISVVALNDDAKAGQLDLPKGKIKTDEWLGEQEVYFDEVFGKVAIARATPKAMDLEIELSYQGCKVDGICYMPISTVLSVMLPEATAVTTMSVNGATVVAPVSEQARLAQIITGSSIWVAAGLFFLAGLALAFTPCVLPLVPILSGIIAGEGENVSPMRGFTLALSYVMGMAIVYTAAGVAAAAAGLQLAATFNQPWILILFSGLFVVLAIGMFGAYDLQMPSGVQSRLSGFSGDQKRGTMIGAFVMGALSSLIVTACVAPALIAALTVIAQTGDVLRGGSALFAMSLGMGAPLLLVGAAQGKLLPKAGAWMVAVKNAFGFMMLGLAVWMLSRILPGGVTMLLWAVLVLMTGVFMGGLTTLTTGSSGVQKIGKGFGFLTIIYGVILLLGALSGGSNPMKPLASINFGGGTLVTKQQHELPFQRIKTVDDLDREVAAAASQGKTALLDFYADWCVSCKEMEAYTFTDSDVQAALSNTLWLQADVTANDAADQLLLQRFGVFGPPTIIFFGADGNQRHGYEVVGYMKAEDFVEHVQQAFAVSASMSAELTRP